MLDNDDAGIQGTINFIKKFFEFTGFINNIEIYIVDPNIYQSNAPGIAEHILPHFSKLINNANQFVTNFLSYTNNKPLKDIGELVTVLTKIVYGSPNNIAQSLIQLIKSNQLFIPEWFSIIYTTYNKLSIDLLDFATYLPIDPKSIKDQSNVSFYSSVTMNTFLDAYLKLNPHIKKLDKTDKQNLIKSISGQKNHILINKVYKQPPEVNILLRLDVIPFVLDNYYYIYKRKQYKEDLYQNDKNITVCNYIQKYHSGNISNNYIFNEELMVYLNQIPPILPRLELKYNPSYNFDVNLEENYINTFVPSKFHYMKPNQEIIVYDDFPTIYNIIRHLLNYEQDMITVDDFINWLAAAFAGRQKLLTAWFFVGKTQGVGKNTLTDLIFIGSASLISKTVPELCLIISPL
jgi:hypothetical protein